MKNLILSTFLSVIILPLFAQYENIVVDQTGYPEEPSIMINPKNPDIVLAGSNISNYYYSTDAGYTWTEGNLTSASWGVWGDPVLMVDTTGAFYFFHLSDPPSGNWIDRIVCQKTTDNGLTWNEGTHMGLDGTKAQDKEWAVVDWNNNYIYVTWTQFDDYGSSNPDDVSSIMFSKSTDGGETWMPAMKINEVDGDCIDDDNTTEGAVPAVGPNGEVYVAWAGPEGIVFDKSTDQGETWLDEDIFVSDFPGGWTYDIPGIYRCNGLPVTKCDLSGGSHHGTIYINWTDQRNGSDDTDVWIVKSTDGGETWTSPLRVNDDPPGKHQFFSWMDVDQATGYIYIVFYDRRAYEDSNTDVYMAVSKDGGETFENILISESPFVPYSSVFFGDYTNISAYDGMVRPIWTRLDGSSLSVLTAIADEPNISVKQIADNDLVALEQNSPNPFMEVTYIKFKLHEPQKISLSIYDQLGRKVLDIYKDEMLQRGKYLESVDAQKHNLNPGVYFFRLTTPEKTIQKKMIVAG